jgi:hypothetical protein
VSFVQVDEWEYDAAFYQGLRHFVSAQGISGFNLHTPISTGDLAPAFSRTQYRRLGLMNFD